MSKKYQNNQKMIRKVTLGDLAGWAFCKMAIFGVLAKRELIESIMVKMEFKVIMGLYRKVLERGNEYQVSKY